MEYTFDQVADLLDEMAETFPPVFFEQLNGGILLQEEAKPDPMFPEGEVYFMGEYVQDSYLGRYINLYYGSFLASARNEGWSEETWREELYTTLAHEFTHQWNPWPTPTVWMTRMRKSCFVFWRNIGTLPDA